MSTFTVASTLDNGGSGTLRTEIGLADDAGGGTVSLVGLTGTISLNSNSGALLLTNSSSTPIIIVGPGASSLTVSGNNAATIFEIEPSEGQLIASISGLTITDGDANVSGGSNRGGAIDNEGGTLTLTNCTISNSVANTGGGIYSNGSLSLVQCAISDNTAHGNGGGIANRGGTLTISQCVISGDSADESGSAGKGGGVYNDNGLLYSSYNLIGASGTLGAANTSSGDGAGVYSNGNASSQNDTVSGNTAAGDGGGIFNIGTLTVLRDILANDSSDDDGGGIDNSSLATIELASLSGDSSNEGGAVFNMDHILVNQSTLSSDTAQSLGGAIYNAGSYLELTNSTLSGDSVTFSGGEGGGLDNGAAANSYLANCTIANDSVHGAGSYGGGVCNYSSGNLTLINCTIAGDSAITGGGVEVLGGNVLMYNNIVANGTGGDIDGDNVSTSSADNLVDSATSYGGLQATSGNVIGTSADLGTLTNNGGPTDTMALMSGSPSEALNGGDTAVLFYPAGQPDSTPIVTDQRGDARTADVDGTLVVSMGAYEYGGGTFGNGGSTLPALQVNTTLDLTQYNPGNGLLSLRAAIGFANQATGASTITFSPTVFASSQTIILSSGDLILENIGAPIIIDGPATAALVNANGSSSVLQVNPMVTATIDDLNMTEGYVGGGNGGDVNNAGTLTLTSCSLSGLNVDGTIVQSATNGGIIYNSGYVSVINCSLTGGYANGGSTPGGGAIYNPAGATAFLNQDVIVGNKSGFDGGGIYSHGNLTVEDSTISSNLAASFGGGIKSDGPLAVISGCVITGNQSNSVGGGLTSANGTVFLSGSLVGGNLAEDHGGGVNDDSDMTLMDDTISNNSAQDSDGGGIDSTGLLDISNCTIANNSAGGTGGGMVVTSNDVISNCTITGNSAGTGGGIGNNSSSVSIYNTVVSGNTASGSESDLVNQPFSGSSSYNLVGTGSAALPSGNGNIVGVSDPMLDPLGYHGGSLPTMPPLADSLAITGGKVVSSTPPQDERGVDRPASGVIAIGAVQVGAGTTQVLMVNTISDAGSLANGPVNGTGGPILSLRGAFAVADSFSGATAIYFDPTIFGTTAQHITLTGTSTSIMSTGDDTTVYAPDVGLTVVGSLVNDSLLTIIGGRQGSPLAIGVSGTAALAGAITGTGALTVGSTTTVGFVQLAALPEGTGTLTYVSAYSDAQSALTISAASYLDVTNNRFYINYADGGYSNGPDPIASVVDYLSAAYNGGTQSFSTLGVGIVSSTVGSLNASQTAGSHSTIYSIGYADGANGLISGLSTGQILIMPTLAGDLRLQGDVTFGDDQVLDQNFGLTGGWDEGNFSYQVTVDFGDFQMLSQDFGKNDSALFTS